MGFLIRFFLILFIVVTMLSGCEQGDNDSNQNINGTIAPSAPDNLSAATTGNSVILSWNAVENAETYKVYLAQESGVSPSNYQQLMNGDVYVSNSRQLEITNLAKDTRYYIVITALSNGVESDTSMEINFLIPSPTNGPVTAVSTAKTIIVSWDSLTAADSYNLYIAREPGISPDTIDQLQDGKIYSNVTSSFDITGLTKNVSYFILVTAVSANVESAVAPEIEQVIANAPLLNPTAIATSNYGSCALDDNGITCWGDGFHHIAEVPYIENPIAIAGGTGHFCALLSDTSLKCWGWNSFGQSTPPPSLTNVTAVSAGSHTCALLQDKSLNCWGNDVYGQLTLPNLTNPSMISVGGLHSCALDDSGIVCWGYNGNGESTVPSLTNPRFVAAGLYNTCAIDDNGVQCWGRDINNYVIPTLTNPFALEVGLYHACAIDSIGVKCWGANDKGQLNVPALSNPSAISAGNEFNCALDDNGVHCWGDSLSGQLQVP